MIYLREVVGRGGCGKKLLDSGGILKAEPRGFPDRQAVSCGIPVLSPGTDSKV